MPCGLCHWVRSSRLAARRVFTARPSTAAQGSEPSSSQMLTVTSDAPGLDHASSFPAPVPTSRALATCEGKPHSPHLGGASAMGNLLTSPHLPRKTGNDLIAELGRKKRDLLAQLLLSLLEVPSLPLCCARDEVSKSNSKAKYKQAHLAAV